MELKNNLFNSFHFFLAKIKLPNFIPIEKEIIIAGSSNIPCGNKYKIEINPSLLETKLKIIPITNPLDMMRIIGNIPRKTPLKIERILTNALFEKIKYHISKNPNPFVLFIISSIHALICSRIGSNVSSEAIYGKIYPKKKKNMKSPIEMIM
ncbi:MAG: hypothetical protein QXH60_02915 [Candidatus Pacearchaeota archaeon]